MTFAPTKQNQRRKPTATRATPSRGVTLTPQQLDEAEALDRGSEIADDDTLHLVRRATDGAVPSARDAALLALTSVKSGRVTWLDYRHTGITGAEIEKMLERLWSGNGVAQTDVFGCSRGGRAGVWYDEAPDDDDPPDLEGGELYEAIRRVWEIPPIDDPFEKIKTNGKSRAKVSGSALAAGSAPAPGRSSYDPLIVRMPVATLDDSPWQTRDAPSAAWLKELGDTIERDGQASPCLVRQQPNGRAQLIAGHTRKAVALARNWTHLECRVVYCDDATAERLVLLENAKRKELNELEKARAYAALRDRYQAAGRKQSELATDLGISDSALSNTVRLLSLPEIWQQRVAAGDVAPSAARELVPWVGEPGVMKQLESSLKCDPKTQWSANLPDYLRGALRSSSRPLKENYYYDHSGRTSRNRDVDLKPTAEQLEQLRVRKVGQDERAFNLELWEQLQSANEKARTAREAAKRDKSSPKGKAGLVDPAEARAAAKKQAEQLNKRLYRFKIAWLQAQIVGDLTDPSFDRETLLALLVWLTTRDGHHKRLTAIGTAKNGSLRSDLLNHLLNHDGEALWSIVRELCVEQVGGKFDGYHNVFDPSDLETLARILDIDLRRDWPTSFDEGASCDHLWDDFVGLWSRSQLVDLLVEWKTKTPHLNSETAKRGDLAACLLATKPCPKAILEAKAVLLT